MKLKFLKGNFNRLEEESLEFTVGNIVAPLICGGYILSPPVDACNYREYQTLYIYYAFSLYICSYDKV